MPGITLGKNQKTREKQQDFLRIFPTCYKFFFVLKQGCFSAPSPAAFEFAQQDIALIFKMVCKTLRARKVVRFFFLWYGYRCIYEILKAEIIICRLLKPRRWQKRFTACPDSKAYRDTVL